MSNFNKETIDIYTKAAKTFYLRKQLWGHVRSYTTGATTLACAYSMVLGDYFLPTLILLAMNIFFIAWFRNDVQEYIQSLRLNLEAFSTNENTDK